MRVKPIAIKTASWLRINMVIKSKRSITASTKKGVATLVSTAEGLAGARLDKCGGDLKKAFKWSSTKIKYWGSVGKPKKDRIRLNIMQLRI